METTKKIHKWIVLNVNGNYLKRLIKYDLPEFEDGSRMGSSSVDKIIIKNNHK